MGGFASALAVVLVIVHAQEDCGDLHRDGIDHEAKAIYFSNHGNLNCALRHRIRAAVLFADADSYFNLAIAHEELKQFKKAKKAW
jgi:hypothetical protein